MKTTSLPRRAGFSLIEMLAVIAILVVLIGVLVPAFHSVGRASQLTNATAIVVDEFNLARQTALARNRIVEVRFYSLRHELDSTRAYRAVRTLVADEDGKVMLPLEPLKTFPIGIVALKDDQFSTLLSDTLRPSQTTDTEDLPSAPATPYKALRFRPTGGVELTDYTSSNDTWFLTLKNETDPNTSQRPANNFATIQVDPVTGRTRQFRP